MRVLKLLGAASLIFSTTYSYGQYFKTLPEGVRLFAYRHVEVPEVGSSFNHTKSETPYSFELQADAKALSDIAQFQAVFQSLGLPENFSLGTYHLEAKGNVQVDGYGFGYGITNKLTAYTSIPVYSATVALDYKRKSGNNYAEVAGNMQSNGDSYSQMVGNMIESLPDLDGPTIQSVIVNTFGYEELGTWEGQGLGDMELGLIYNLRDETTWGLATSFGVVLPTGRVDDPDIIQDFGFGDGQTDVFAEFGGGYSLGNGLWLNSYLRYTYQIAADKELRVPYSEGAMVSDEKGTFNEKLGNKWDFALQSDYTINDWFSVTGSYLYNYMGEAQYYSSYGVANDYLAQDTESSSHNLRMDLTLSSITPFLKKEFLLPAQVRLSYQTMIAGMNTNKIDRIELEFRMMF